MTKHLLQEQNLDIAYFAEIVKIASDAIIIIDQTQRIIFFNQGAEETFGYPASEILGQPLNVLLPPAYRQAHNEHIERFATADIVAKRMSDRSEISAQRKNGDIFPAEASITKFATSDDLLFAVILRDISERKNLEAAFRDTERDRVMAETAGAAAHELCQPLNVMQGLAELILDDLPVEGSLRDDLQTLCEQIEIIDGIIRTMQNSTHYETKPYAQGMHIVDFDASSQ